MSVITAPSKIEIKFGTFVKLTNLRLILCLKPVLRHLSVKLLCFSWLRRLQDVLSSDQPMELGHKVPISLVLPCHSMSGTWNTALFKETGARHIFSSEIFCLNFCKKKFTHSYILLQKSVRTSCVRLFWQTHHTVFSRILKLTKLLIDHS